MDYALAPADLAWSPGLSLAQAGLRRMRDRRALPVLRRGPYRSCRSREAGQGWSVLVTATGCDGHPAQYATGDPGARTGEIPGWLLHLARSAERMDVPAGLRPPAGGGRHSAILILFGEAGAGPDVLLVQRSSSLRRHAGQPAFPGGVIDAEDDGPVGAALREAAEEAGVDPSGVDVVSVLPDLLI